jgi:hypothetical protein
MTRIFYKIRSYKIEKFQNQKFPTQNVSIRYEDVISEWRNFHWPKKLDIENWI